MNDSTETPLVPPMWHATMLGNPEPSSEPAPRTAPDDVDRIPVIYIAGAYSAEDPWGVEKNVRAAEEAAYELEAIGASTICPHTNTRFQDSRTPYEQKIKTTLAALRRCDAVFFLRGWVLSSGARGEHIEAQRRGKVLLFDLLQAGIYVAERLKGAA